MNLNAGEYVTIKVKNPIWPMRKAYASYMDIPEFNTYSGAVVLNHKAVKPGQIGLTTSDPYNPGFDMRVIDIDRIVGEDNQVIAPPPSDTKTWEVQGSKGKTYTVIADHGRYSCSCPAYQFRHSCKHIDEIKKGS